MSPAVATIVPYCVSSLRKSASKYFGITADDFFPLGLQSADEIRVRQRFDDSGIQSGSNIRRQVRGRDNSVPTVNCKTSNTSAERCLPGWGGRELELRNPCTSREFAQAW